MADLVTLAAPAPAPAPEPMPEARGLRVAIAGTGAMAVRHADAFAAIGCEITVVLARPEGSARRREAFLSRFGGIRVAPGAAALAGDPSWDLAVVAVATGAALEVTELLARTGRTVLTEKPVAHSPADLDRLAPFAAHVMVGYNRRFYDSVAAARAFVRSGGPVVATVVLPEAIRDAPDRPRIESLRPLFENGVHALDLAHVLFDVHASDVRGLERVSTTGGEPVGVVGLLVSARGDVVTITGPWSSPANTTIEAHRPGERFELRPIEIGRRYDAMEVLEADDTTPIKRYIPRVAHETGPAPDERAFKPGFLAQARAVVQLHRTGAHGLGATIDDARAALALADLLAGGPLDGPPRK